jgi:hypothetical protein
VFGSAGATEAFTEVMFLHEIVGRDRSFVTSSNTKTNSATTPKITQNNITLVSVNIVRSVTRASQVFGSAVATEVIT